MCQGGIYDHLGGGFARYSVDEHWLVPHFEKMLYDNAQLLDLLCVGLCEPPAMRCSLRRAEETVAGCSARCWPKAAFASALDADSEGEEGRFYVWDAGRDRPRSWASDAPIFRLAYGVTDAGNWEGHNVLNRLHEPSLPPAEEADLLARCRRRFSLRRQLRVPPGRDDKVLADWNGLMIAALAQASGQLGRPDWLQLAEQAFAAILRQMSEGDRLFHSWRAGRRLPMAFLDDYAQMSRAALGVFQQTGTPSYLDHARAWVQRCEADFHDDHHGGYFLSAAAADGPIVQPKNAHDGPTPSANGTLAEVTATLWHLTGDDRYRAMTDDILAAFASDARTNPASHATLLVATRLLTGANQIVVMGDEVTPGFVDLWAAATASAPAAAFCNVSHRQPSFRSRIRPPERRFSMAAPPPMSAAAPSARPRSASLGNCANDCPGPMRSVEGA